ncbi:MAG: aspartate carbamoyltransferase [Candidatus Levybacteria bacterium]|nr:aspartate carbamoyltransferase [Candidatus Levybacteria bacterium]
MANFPDKINGNFKNKDIVSLDQFSLKDIKTIFSLVPKMKQICLNAKPSKVIAGKIIVLLFYEPSSRTFGSFSGAVKQLGGQTIEIQNPQEFSSVSKGETFEDTIRVFEAYSDAIILRHPVAGHAINAANTATLIPVINAGDGIGEHPTQALLDLYTIYEKHKRLDNLTGVMAGDMLNGRTIHSLIRGLSLFEKNTIYLMSPKKLKLSREDYGNFSKRGIKLIEIDNVRDMPKNAHFWYWTRVQKERFNNLKVYEKVKSSFVVTKKLLDSYGNKNMILMHPLPRITEIERDVDNDPRAVYLKTEIRNGMYVRMALISLVMGGKI